MAKFTAKQQAFINEYLIDLNITAAALRAGYSEKTAYSIGQRLLKNVEIQKAINEAMNKREERTEVTADMVVKQLAKIAFSDLKDFVSWNDKRVTIRSPEEVDGTVLSEIQEQWTETRDGFKNGRTKVKLNDKMKALELLGRHLGMFNDKLQVNGDLEIVVDVVDDEE